MTIYILAITSAAVLQIGTIYFLRGDFFGNLLYTVPFVLLYQFLFLWSYAKAPNFIVIWFITTALTGILSFIAGYYLWHERMSLLNLTGIVLIIGGVILLNLK